MLCGEVMEWIHIVVEEAGYGGLERAERLFGGKWHSGDLLDVRWLGAALLVVLAILLPMAAHHYYRQRRLRAKPLATFQRVAGDIGLSLRDRWLLLKIARHEALPSPLTLLLSRATLHHHARQYAQGLVVSRRLKVMRRVAALRQMLYS